MKSVLGIVAEYDPFHNGHAYHMSAAINAVHPDCTYVVMSGYFRQRGCLSLLSPHVRASCAIYAGADAVFMLPTLWTLRNAENYALGAMSALSDLGCTHIAFGAETDDSVLLQKTAVLLETPTEAFQSKLHSELSSGIGYPAAIHAAVSAVMPEAANLLKSPNNILAVCYLRAVIRLGLSMIPVVIRRNGSYHSENVQNGFPSASTVRSALIRGNWNGVLTSVPDYTAEYIKKAFITHQYPDMKRWNDIVIYSLRMLPKEKRLLLPDISEGLEDKLLSSAINCTDINHMIDACVSRRVPAARVSRILSWAAIGGEYEESVWNRLPDYLQLLALRKGSDMTKEWKKRPLHICSSLLETGDSESAEFDRKAARLWALCCGLPDGCCFREKVFTL